MLKSKKIEFKFKKAFTLAEVLIVVCIIGMISEMTIPTLISNVNNLSIASGFMKNYGVLYDASRVVINDSGGDILNGYDSAQELSDALASKLKVARSCANGAANGICWPNLTELRNLHGDNFLGNYNDNSPTFQLIDGTVIRFYNGWFRKDCSLWPRDIGGKVEGVCDVIHMDVNGMKPPNQLGRDIFEMYFYPTYGILPDGIQNSDDDYKKSNTCDPAASRADSGCGCAARVLDEHGIYY